MNRDNKRWLRLLKGLIPSVMQIVTLVAIGAAVVIGYQFGARGSGEREMAMAAGAATRPATRPASSPAHASHPADLNGDGMIFTCSMHPQVQLDEAGKCPICGMELVIQDVGMVAEESHAVNEPAGYACAMNCVPPLPEAGDCPVCGMEMQPVFDGGGRASRGGDPSRRKVLTNEAKALARVETAPVVRGVAESTRRLVGQLAIDTSRRKHISADVGGRIDALTAKYEGDRVTEGQDLVLFYSPELLAVQNEYLQAARMVESLSADAPASVRKAASLAEKAAGERLRLAGLSNEQVGEIRADGKAREQVTLKSPMSGTVITRHAEEGEYIARMERILTIADLSVLWGDLQAYESDLAWLSVGQDMEFTTEAWPGRVFEGRIDWINPVTNAATRTTDIRVTIDNAEGALKPGMYVTGTVTAPLNGGEAVLLVPDGAPLLTGTRAIVYVEVPGEDAAVYEGREVVLGARTDEGYVVTSGLAEGERVVVHGAFQIDSALQILARPSMMNPAR